MTTLMTGRPRDKKHVLVRKVRGGNQYTPGFYLCKCGQSFTGYNLFERHRARENKKIREGDK
jgi:hypothetical protein